MEPTVDTAVIYHNQTQIIQEWPMKSLDQIGIPESANVDSLLLLGHTPNGHIIVPYTVTKPVIPLTPSHATFVTVQKGNELHKGYLYSHDVQGDNRSATLYVEDASGNGRMVMIWNYDSMEQVGINSHHLHHINVIPNPPQLLKNVTMTYLTEGVFWRGNYTILLDTQKVEIDLLRYVANVTNQQKIPFRTQKTLLVAGSVNSTVVPRSGIKLQARAMSLSTVESSEVESHPVDEYIEYVTDGVYIESESSLPLELFALTSIPCTKWYIGSFGYDTSLRFGYRFEAPQTLPSGSAIIYSRSANGVIGELLGSTSIQESRIGKEVELILGETTSILMTSQISQESTQVTEGNIKKTYLVVRLRAALKNLNNKQANVILQYPASHASIRSTKVTPGWKIEQKGANVEISRTLLPSQDATTEAELVIGA